LHKSGFVKGMAPSQPVSAAPIQAAGRDAGRGQIIKAFAEVDRVPVNKFAASAPYWPLW
jgi:hypothetical protein